MHKEPITSSFSTFDNHISKVLGALNNQMTLPSIHTTNF